ncbi:MAG TPA: 2Fe-2S iron-sulfur cluster-binding protein, partial [Bacteroidales bacterium]|nr:2Fe-2S iron-sulfur cluster-binding protein [Bacteroidales bacterium]
ACISIPTLCHRDGTEPYSSCMVCMVKDKIKNNFIPSCTASVQDGMDIDASGEETIELRRKAVELLLLEHRAECEAPCRIVCPAGYNIPLMNRLLQEDKIEEAIKLAEKEVTTAEIICVDCPGYCENACRRKKIDEPVSIRNIMLCVSRGIDKDRSSGGALDEDIKAKTKLDLKKMTNPVRKKFSSRIGRLESHEQSEWLKECRGDGTRYREITDFTTAGREAENCMHCDCRASDNCRLREVAVELGVKDPSGKLVNAPITKKINLKSGLVFESAKCIKCGLCVRVCDDSKENPSLCFINRGFITIISEPLTSEFEDILEAKAEKCVEVCPTGALGLLR